MKGIFDQAAYEAIGNELTRRKRRPNDAAHIDQIPAVDALIIVVDACFQVSIESEEHRPIRLAVAILEKKGYIKHEWRPGGRALEASAFDKALPFSPHTLKKLALAMDPYESCLLVQRNERGDQFEIWGMAYTGGGLSLGSLPISSLFPTSYPAAVTLRIESPGALAVIWGDSMIGLFSSGRFTAATPTPFSSEAMGVWMLKAIAADEGFVRYNTHYWRWYRRTLDFILRKIAFEQHGGTLIVIPKQHLTDALGCLNIRYGIDSAYRINEILISIIENENDTSAGPAQTIRYASLSESLVGRVSAVAKLSSVDGALIVQSDLHVLGFGATLRAPAWTGSVIVGHDGFNANGQVFPIDKLGTRHGSAVAFVAQNPGTVAFVVSSDGPVRGFTKGEGSVLCWPDIRASMTAWKAG